jgi:hypothetical protein
LTAALASIALYLRKRGVSDDDLLSSVVEAASTRCQETVRSIG